jgi:hypothetical protein
MVSVAHLERAGDGVGRLKASWHGPADAFNTIDGGAARTPRRQFRPPAGLGRRRCRRRRDRRMDAGCAPESHPKLSKCSTSLQRFTASESVVPLPAAEGCAH